MNLIDLDNITIGSDPEFFIVDSQGKIVSSMSVTDGTTTLGNNNSRCTCRNSSTLSVVLKIGGIT